VTSPSSPWTRTADARSRALDDLLTGALRVVAGTSALLLALLLASLVIESLDALRHLRPGRFLTDPSWHPLEGRFLLVPMIQGTLLVTFGAVALATPLGLLVAVGCREYAPRPVAAVMRRVVELLAGIPSVVYGFWGLVVLVPWIAARLGPPGTSVLAGILVLALMLLPTVALTADAALGAVPARHRRAAAALGLSRPTTILRVLLPAARGGILSGTLLQLARALGETMAVLMVCGNVARTPEGLLDPVRTLTANIALEMAYAMGDHRSALFVGGLTLMALVTLLLLAAEWVHPPEARLG